MKPSASVRDTLITFVKREQMVNDDDGTRSYAWTTHAQEWAEVQDVLPSRGERIADGISISRRPARIRTLYRDDIDSTMRIALGVPVLATLGTVLPADVELLEIVAGPAELGRRDGLEMMAERQSTQGNAP